MMGSALTIAIPLGIPWLSAFVLAPLDGRRTWVGWLGVGALALTFAACLWVAVVVLAGGTIEVIAGDLPAGVGIRLRVDALGAVFAVLVNAVLLAGLSYEVTGQVHARTFPALVAFMSAGLTGLFFTGDVFNFYVFFEVAMASAFVLTAYGRRPNTMRAALVFMVVNLLGSVFFLGGIGALYHITGTLDMPTLAARAQSVPPSTLILVGIMIFVALATKLGLFPFHFWLPVVYRDSQPVVAAILAGALTNIGSYGLLRFGANLLPGVVQYWAAALIVLGLLSVLYGELVAVSSALPSEVLAYSSIGQVGYILVAIGIGGQVGYTAAVLFAVVNSLNKTALFLTIGRKGRLTGAVFATAAFSVAGVPPVVGFFAKFSVFRAAVAVGDIAVVAVVVLGGALSLVYMFRTYQRQYWEQEPRPSAHPLGAEGVVVALALIILLLGAWPEPLLAISQQAAGVLAGES